MHEKTELEQAIEELELDYECAHVALIDKSESWPAPHDVFRVKLARNGKTFETEYRAGIGYRTTIPGFRKDAFGIVRNHAGGKEPCTELQAAHRGYTRVTMPSCANVLECLLSDASGADQTFEDWASDLGFDPDSRKALATYLACQKTRAALVKMLGSESFETLAAKEH